VLTSMSCSTEFSIIIDTPSFLDTELGLYSYNCILRSVQGTDKYHAVNCSMCMIACAGSITLSSSLCWKIEDRKSALVLTHVLEKVLLGLKLLHNIVKGRTFVGGCFPTRY